MNYSVKKLALTTLLLINLGQAQGMRHIIKMLRNIDYSSSNHMLKKAACTIESVGSQLHQLVLHKKSIPAPKYIQDFTEQYIYQMSKERGINPEKIAALKENGGLQVRVLPMSFFKKPRASSPDTYNDYSSTHAYNNYINIYLNPLYAFLGGPLFEPHIICHEASHILDFLDSHEPQDILTMTKKEYTIFLDAQKDTDEKYRAEQQAITSMYYTYKNYGAIKFITKVRVKEYKKNPTSRYARGTIDTVTQLCTQHPEDLQLQKIGQSMAFQLGDSSEVLSYIAPTTNDSIELEEFGTDKNSIF